jgi:hypothetical protein
MNLRILVPLFHILFVVPVFLFVAYQKAATPLPMYYVFNILAALIFVYHTYKAYMRMQDNSPYVWVNLIHIVVIAPLLAYIGFKEKEAARAAYEVLAMVAFGALGYHLMNIVMYLQVRNSGIAGGSGVQL